MQIELKNYNNRYDSYSNHITNLDPTQRAWIEVSGTAISNNVKQIKKTLKENCKFMAVVKADGYGHDARFVSKYAIAGGADQLGVATLQEGIHLRNAGISIPILVLGNIYEEKDLSTCFKYDLMPTISTLRECLICNDIGQNNNSRYSIHLKIDTGMSRLGFDINDLIQQFKTINSCGNIVIAGIYSHLATADERDALNERSFTQMQKNKFIKVLNELQISNKQEINIHLANSAGTFLSDQFHFNMVRVGLAMYGYLPSKTVLKDLNLQPALSLKAKVSFIRIIDENTSVSYGRDFISRGKMKLGVVGIGYADGISRKLSNKISLIHNGELYSQVGAITMDQLMIDITKASKIKVGDTVSLLGEDGGITISPIEWSNKCQSIPWEILCAFKNRLPRVQIK